jgi:hypothetical protein
MASLLMRSIMWFLWRGRKNCGIECSVPGRYCVELRPTCPDVLVLCAVDHASLAFLRSVRLVLVSASVVPSSCHPDEGGATFLRNSGSYKSHTA